MKKFLLKFAVLSGTLALTACRSDPLGPAGVQVDIRTQDPRLFAGYFVMAWMDEQSQLFQVRVPEDESMFIDEEQAPAVSVFVALDPARPGRRRVLVRGYRDGQIISEGAAKLDTDRNVWVELGLEMKAAGSLPDQDGDGLPDTVDNCPQERDPCGGTPPPPEQDAGADGAPDAAPDVAPDASPDLPEAGPVNPTGIPDAAPDVTPDAARRDVRAS